MKTNDLIAALASDPLPGAGAAVSRTIGIAALLGTAVTGVAFLFALGWRPDIDTALRTVRFPFKFVVTVAVIASAAPLVLQLARPAPGDARRSLSLWAGPVLMLAGVAIELLVLPSSVWATSLVGSNAWLCLTAIPLLSIAPLVALLLALRRGAPTRPRVAGAMAGLLAASIAATLYALHCDDDSPLFVLVWYSLAIALVTAVAAAVGGRLLRW